MDPCVHRLTFNLPQADHLEMRERALKYLKMREAYSDGPAELVALWERRPEIILWQESAKRKTKPSWFRRLFLRS